MKSFRSWLLIVAPMLAVLAVVGLASYALLARPRDADLKDALRAAWLDRETTMDADFATLFAGDWDRVVVVCRGAGQSDVSRALGFESETVPRVDSAAFLSAMIFASGDRVEYVVATGPDSDWPYVPCATPAERTESVPSEPYIAVLLRADAVVRFTHHTTSYTQYWSVAPTEFQRLRSLTPPAR